MLNRFRGQRTLRRERKRKANDRSRLQTLPQDGEGPFPAVGGHIDFLAERQVLYGERFTVPHPQTGKAVIETNWHSIVAREGKYVKDLEKLKKGNKVYVQGRLRYQKISGDDGSERMFADIVANRLMVIDDPEPMSYEM